MRFSTQNIACSHRQMYICIHHSVIHCEHTTCNQGSRTYLINSTPVLEKEKKKEKEKRKKEEKEKEKSSQSKREREAKRERKLPQCVTHLSEGLEKTKNYHSISERERENSNSN